MASHVVVWQSTGAAGMEMAAVEIDGGTMSARGTVVATHPEPFVISYELETGTGYVTTSLTVSAWGSGWSRNLDLRRRHDDVWIARPGGYLRELDAALDCDLAGSCLTNTMPVLRHGLHERAGTVEFLMVWISVPDLALHTSHQRYTHLTRRPAGGAAVRFQSGSFAADLTVDPNGFVMDYPGLAERVS